MGEGERGGREGESWERKRRVGEMGRGREIEGETEREGVIEIDRHTNRQIMLEEYSHVTVTHISGSIVSGGVGSPPRLTALLFSVCAGFVNSH